MDTAFDTRLELIKVHALQICNIACSINEATFVTHVTIRTSRAVGQRVIADMVGDSEDGCDKTGGPVERRDVMIDGEPHVETSLIHGLMRIAWPRMN